MPPTHRPAVSNTSSKPIPLQLKDANREKETDMDDAEGLETIEEEDDSTSLNEQYFGDNMSLEVDDHPEVSLLLSFLIDRNRLLSWRWSLTWRLFHFRLC